MVQRRRNCRRESHVASEGTVRMLAKIFSPRTDQHQTRKTLASRQRRRRLKSESLETRLVMAAAIDLTPEGLLTIEGDAGNNRIAVAVSPGGERLRVSVDGEVTDFPAEQIDRIRIAAGPGNDSVRVARNVMTPTRIFGGLGNDRLYAGSGPTFVQGGEGNDRIRGGAAIDFLLGGPGRDLISGGPSADLIVGGSGNDRLSGNAGDDSILGDGVDQIPDDTEDARAFVLQSGDQNSGRDYIYGGEGNDRVFAGAGNDRVRGGTGNDLINGGDGHDRLYGDRGNDELIGGLGRDAIRGGLGADIIRARDGVVDIILADESDELIVDEFDRVLGL